MSKDASLFASIEWDGKTLLVYGYMAAEELKRIAEDFKAGVEVRHVQVEIRE